MKPSFRNLAILCALVCFVLSFIWLFAPQFLLSLWSVELSSPSDFIARRSAALFAGLAITFYLVRNAEPSPARSAIATGFSVACFFLAALGIFELATGHAGIGILSAIVTEIILGCCLWHFRHCHPV